MRRLLGEQADAFQASYLQPPVAGLRINTLKIAPGELRRRLPYHLKPLPWTQSGFQLAEAADDPSGSPGLAPALLPPGKHVYHAAGLYYLQEPSAMAVAELLNPRPGEAVLDLCAAPGGKTTHLAGLMDNQGLLVANETHPKRVWELAENLERWGARNTIITNESPARLAERLGGNFDKILVDAPCSGEGMFRKSESARRDWSPEQIVYCAQRQTAILDSAAQMLKPGGLLAYSTCTFNPLENEGALARFLKSHPDFEILPVDPLPGCAQGQPGWLPPEDSLPELAHTLRIWPHLASGEGHFVALLRRNSDQSARTGSLAQKFDRQGAQKHSNIRQTGKRAHATTHTDDFAQPMAAGIPEFLPAEPASLGFLSRAGCRAAQPGRRVPLPAACQCSRPDRPEDHSPRLVAGRVLFWGRPGPVAVRTFPCFGVGLAR